MDFLGGIVEFLYGTLRFASVVLIFSLLVIGHEFGHFLMAKASGMRVDEFAVGFGKNIFKWRRGETLYTINLLPIGGYNKIYGMDIEEEEDARKRLEEEEKLKDVNKSTSNTENPALSEPKAPKNAPPDYSVAPRDDPRAFVNRPIYQRFAVVLSGPVANILIAILVVFVMGTTIGLPAAELGGVVPGGPADIAGLQQNDIITHLNGARLASTSDLLQAVAFSHGNPIRMAGTRGSENFDTTVFPREIRLVDSYLCRLGFIYGNDSTIMYVIPDTPAERAGLEAGDNIVTVDGLMFPSSRLDVSDGDGVVNFGIYRGLSTVNVAVDYFNRELIRDSYSPYLFFFRESMVDTWSFKPSDPTATDFNLVDFSTPNGVLGWTLHGPDGIIDYDFQPRKNSRITWEGLDPDLSYFLSIIVPAGSDYTYDFTIDGESLPESAFVGSENATIVTGTVTRGIADKAGLKAGDRIMGGVTRTWSDSPVGEPVEGPLPVTIDYLRNGKAGSALLEPDNQPFARILVFIKDAAIPKLVGLPYDHPMARAGIKSGDVIKSINGVPTPNGISAFLELQQNFGKDVKVVLMSKGEEAVFTIRVPGEDDTNGVNSFFGGLHFQTRYFREDPVTAMVAGIHKSQELAGFIFMMIGMLVNGQASAGDLVGPVGIVSITYEAASNGLVDLIHIMVFLSINLAIFNLLPFPALDGGRMIFMLLEGIFRRPVVTVRIENIIHFAGFALLLLFALFVTYHDIARLIFGN